ncbi:hypothetical protein [Emticicia fontis]
MHKNKFYFPGLADYGKMGENIKLASDDEFARKLQDLKLKAKNDNGR